MREMAKIKKITRPRPGIIHAHFASGEIRAIELWRYARKDTVFEQLKDWSFASMCRVADGGSALRWPNGMDMSAGAVRKMGKRIDEPGPVTQRSAAKRNAVSNAKRVKRTSGGAGAKQIVAVHAGRKDQ